MSIILQSLTMPALLEAIEANLGEEMAWFGRALPRGELHKTPELLWIYTGPGSPNGVIHSSFASEEPAYVSRRIDEMMSFYLARGVSFGWTTGSLTRPAHLASLLEARGFSLSGSTTAMAIDVQAMREDLPLNRELTISEIDDLQSLQSLRAIEMQGFDASAKAAQTYYDTYAHAGFGHSLPWHHYLGSLRGAPVAIATLLYHAGVAGIFGVATIPAARRQGVAASMTLHLLHEARKQGYRIAVLSPTEMSEAIYRRIGFQSYGTLLHYGSPRG